MHHILNRQNTKTDNIIISDDAWTIWQMYPNILNWIEISCKGTMADLFLSVCKWSYTRAPQSVPKHLPVYRNIYLCTKTFVGIYTQSFIGT